MEPRPHVGKRSASHSRAKWPRQRWWWWWRRRQQGFWRSELHHGGRRRVHYGAAAGGDAWIWPTVNCYAIATLLLACSLTCSLVWHLQHTTLAAALDQTGTARCYFCNIAATEAERRISLVLFLFFPFSVPLILRCMNTFGLVYPLSCVIHPQLEPQSHSFENYVLVSNPVRIGVSVCVCGSTCAYTNPLAPRTDGARLELRGQAAVVALTLSRRDSSTNSRGPCQKTTAL